MGALGVSLGSFGHTWSALWRPLGDHFGLLGLRLAPLVLSWHAFGYDVGDPEDKIKRITTTPTSLEHLFGRLVQTSHLHLSFAQPICVFQFQLSCADLRCISHLNLEPLVCISQFYLSFVQLISTSNLQLSFDPPFFSRAPLLCISEVHLSFTPLSLRPLVCSQKSLRALSQNSLRALSEISQISLSSLGEVSKKSVRSLSEVSQSSLRTLSEVSQSSL